MGIPLGGKACGIQIIRTATTECAAPPARLSWRLRLSTGESSEEISLSSSHRRTAERDRGSGSLWRGAASRHQVPVADKMHSICCGGPDCKLSCRVGGSPTDTAAVAEFATLQAQTAEVEILQENSY